MLSKMKRNLDLIYYILYIKFYMIFYYMINDEENFKDPSISTSTKENTDQRLINEMKK